jgi:hypothetical protein
MKIVMLVLILMIMKIVMMVLMLAGADKHTDDHANNGRE